MDVKMRRFRRQLWRKKLWFCLPLCVVFCLSQWTPLVVQFTLPWSSVDGNTILSKIEAGAKDTLTTRNIFPNRTVSDVSCDRLFQGNSGEQIIAVKKTDSAFRCHFENVIKIGRQLNNHSCAQFVSENGFLPFDFSSAEEREFPLAFSVMVFRDVCQVVRLLRAIYRPHNFYCIHVDSKSSEHMFRVLTTLARCLSNVFIAEPRMDVRWGEYSVLATELICMRLLLKRAASWRYFINLTGQEYPLRTNWNIVRILKNLHGSNNLEALFDTVFQASHLHIFPTQSPNFRFTYYKGSAHAILCRRAVEYIIWDERSHNLLRTFKTQKTFAPEEIFYSTLNHNPIFQFPGGYWGHQFMHPQTHRKMYPFLARLKNFVNRSHRYYYPCRSGLVVRWLCIWGVMDLPLISRQPELFVNKLYMHFQPRALDCLEERLWRFMKEEFDTGQLNRGSLEGIQNLNFVKQHQQGFILFSSEWVEKPEPILATTRRNTV